MYAAHSRMARSGGAAVLALATCGFSMFAPPWPSRGQASSGAAKKADATRSAPGTQTAAPSPAAATPDSALDVGRTIYAELAQTIDVRNARQGQAISAKATLAVLSHGKVLIADGAKISGRVTEARARSKKEPESVLGIVFDHADLADGTQLPLALTVQAVGVGRFAVPDGLDSDSAYSGTSTVGSFPPSPQHSRIPVAGPGPSGERLGEHPALDLGSKGVVGLKGYTLTEGTGANKGSLVTSITGNVKLARGYELVLRVIAPSQEPSATK